MQGDMSYCYDTISVVHTLSRSVLPHCQKDNENTLHTKKKCPSFVLFCFGLVIVACTHNIKDYISGTGQRMSQW